MIWEYKALLFLLAAILIFCSSAMQDDLMPEKWKLRFQNILLITIPCSAVVGLWIWCE